MKFPAFTAVRSDFVDVTEGLAGNPLKVADPVCTYLPAADWQNWLCSGEQALPTVYGVTNGWTSASDPYASWIIVCNNEFLQNPGCNTGPPNQSLWPNEYPFALDAAPDYLRLSLVHDERPFCDKIPYMSAAYLRGVQGDPVPRMFRWGELRNKILAIDLDIERKTDEQVWMRVLLHFRSSVRRYFTNRNYVFPDPAGEFRINWNWPYMSSFQYPGAVIYEPAQTQSLPNGRHRIEINLEYEAGTSFLEFQKIRPDFLGVEIAIELGPVQNAIAMTLNSVHILE